MINKDSDYGTMQPEYNDQQNQFGSQPGRMAASAAQAGEESSASQGVQGPQTLNNGRTHFNQPGRGSSGGTREALTSPAALPSVLPPERDATAVDLVSRPAQASSRFQDRKGEQTHSENMEGYAFAMHDPGRLVPFEPISAARATFDGADESPLPASSVRGNQRVENRPGYDTQAGFATSRAAGHWGQGAGRNKGHDALRQTKGRKFPQDPFSIADEQEAQVQQMRRTMGTHRPGLRKIFAGTDLQRQRVGKGRPIQENANSLESWGGGQESNPSVNQARAGAGSRNPASLSNRGSPFRFPAKGLNHKALLSAVRGQNTTEGARRTERGSGAAQVPPFRQEQGDLSELQIIAPNQRAMMNKPHQAKLAAPTGGAHRKGSMPGNKIESSASIQRAAMIEAAKNRPMIQIPRHDHLLFHNERENAAKYHLELVAVGKQNGQQDLGPAALASSDRSSLINDLNGQDAHISITPPQKSTDGKLRQAPAPVIGSSFVRHDDLTSNARSHQYAYQQQNRVRVQDESKIEMRHQLGAGIVRPQVNQVERPDQQDCSEFVHLNDKTRLELLQARGQSPRLPQDGSRSKSPRQGASSTGTGQHEQGSSGNCSRMQSTILRVKQGNESQPHRNGQRIERNAIKQSWNTQLDEKSWSPSARIAKLGGLVGPGPQEFDLSPAKQYQKDAFSHDNVQKVECLTSGHEIDRPQHFNEVPIEDSNNSQVLIRKYGNEDLPMRDNSGIANYGQALPALLAASQRHQANPSPRRRPKGAALHTISSGLPDSEHAVNPRAERILAPLGDLSSALVSVVLTGQTARAYRHPTAAKAPPGQRRMPGNQPFRRTFQVEFVAAQGSKDEDPSIGAADEGARVEPSQPTPEKGTLNNLQPALGLESRPAATVDQRGSGSGSREGGKIQNLREIEDLGGDTRSPMLRVAKINRVKRHGTITDQRDPVYRIVEERSVAYGKGAGGGGGKYLVGAAKAGAASLRRVSPPKGSCFPNRAPADRQGHHMGASEDWPKRSSEQANIQQKLTAVYQMNQQISQMQYELAWNQTMRQALLAVKHPYSALDEVGASFADHYSGSIQQISEADALVMPPNTTMPKVNQRICEKAKGPGVQQSPPKPKAGPSIDPNLYDPVLRHDTNGYAVDIVTAPHESIVASQMLDRRDKQMRVLHSQFMQKQMKLSKGFDVANPAKRIKDRLRSKRHTKDILFGEFDSFKNWDTRIVLEDDAPAEGRGTAGP